MRTKLGLVKEVREEVRFGSKEYKRKVLCYHNAKVKPLGFRKGDMMLRNTEAIKNTKVIGKLSPN